MGNRRMTILCKEKRREEERIIVIFNVYDRRRATRLLEHGASEGRIELLTGTHYRFRLREALLSYVRILD